MQEQLANYIKAVLDEYAEETGEKIIKIDVVPMTISRDGKVQSVTHKVTVTTRPADRQQQITRTDYL